jgi:hypothetical protein
MMRLLLRLTIAAIAVALAACGHMPVMSRVKLARIDFTATDPAQLRVAIKLPRAVTPLPNGVALRITVTLADGHEDAQDFILREVSAPADIIGLYKELEADTHIVAYRLEAADVVRVTAFRDALKQKQAATGRKGGALGISARPKGCRTAELGNRPVYFTTYLRTAETGSYVPLARDVDLRTLDPNRDLAASIPPCG